MTKEIKENDATRYLIVQIKGSECKIVHSSDSEIAEVRDVAEKMAVDDPGTVYAIFTKTARALASLKVDWKGNGA